MNSVTIAATERKPIGAKVFRGQAYAFRRPFSMRKWLILPGLIRFAGVARRFAPAVLRSIAH